MMTRIEGRFAALKQEGRAALIWTEAPDLMELSPTVLERALADHVAARAP